MSTGVFVYLQIAAKERLEAKWKHATAKNIVVGHSRLRRQTLRPKTEELA